MMGASMARCNSELVTGYATSNREKPEISQDDRAGQDRDPRCDLLGHRVAPSPCPQDDLPTGYRHRLWPASPQATGAHRPTAPATPPTGTPWLSNSPKPTPSPPASRSRSSTPTCSNWPIAAAGSNTESNAIPSICPAPNSKRGHLDTGQQRRGGSGYRVAQQSPVWRMSSECTDRCRDLGPG